MTLTETQTGTEFRVYEATCDGDHAAPVVTKVAARDKVQAMALLSQRAGWTFSLDLAFCKLCQ